MTQFRQLYMSVGAMKAGTSWLFKQLEDHPDIEATPVKEIHYHSYKHHGTFLQYKERVSNMKGFISWTEHVHCQYKVRQSLRWFARYLKDPVNDEWFHNLFTHRKGIYAAEFSNMNCMLDEAAWAHIKESTAKLRVSYVIRHPIARLWSHMKFHFAVNNEVLDISTMAPKEILELVTGSGCHIQSRYSDIIANLRSCLDREQLGIFFFEDIVSDPLSFMRSMEQFLEIGEKHYSDKSLGMIHNPGPLGGAPARFVEAVMPLMDVQIDGLEKLGYDARAKWVAAQG